MTNQEILARVHAAGFVGDDANAVAETLGVYAERAITDATRTMIHRVSDQYASMGDNRDYYNQILTLAFSGSATYEPGTVYFTADHILRVDGYARVSGYEYKPIEFTYPAPQLESIPLDPRDPGDEEDMLRLDGGDPDDESEDDDDDDGDSDGDSSSPGW